MSEYVELTWLPVKADAKESAAVAELRQMSSELTTRPGLLSSFHGNPIEVPGSLEIIDVWESASAAQAGRTAPAVAKAHALMSSVVDKSNPHERPHTNAYTFSGPVAPVLAAPVTSVSSTFLPAGVDAAAFEETFKSVIGAGDDGPRSEGFLGVVYGWAHNDLEGHPKIDGKAKVFLVLTGWTSVEAHSAAEPAMRERAMQLAKFSEAFEAHHTKFNKA